MNRQHVLHNVTHALMDRQHVLHNVTHALMDRKHVLHNVTHGSKTREITCVTKCDSWVDGQIT